METPCLKNLHLHSEWYPTLSSVGAEGEYEMLHPTDVYPLSHLKKLVTK